MRPQPQSTGQRRLAQSSPLQVPAVQAEREAPPEAEVQAAEAPPEQEEEGRAEREPALEPRQVEEEGEEENQQGEAEDQDPKNRNRQARPQWLKTPAEQSQGSHVSKESESPQTHE